MRRRRLNRQQRRNSMRRSRPGARATGIPWWVFIAIGVLAIAVVASRTFL
ncbi:MAG: hypothetical protein WD208_04595 [Dehalococcoidia bacterium]